MRAAFIDIAHLQPRITINNRVYMEQTTPVSELVVLSRRIEVEHELLHTWVGSSKRVKLHGTFIAKAGFDLRQNPLDRYSPRVKSLFSCRTLRFLASSRNNWTFSRLKTDCGTEFPGRMFKANCQSCPSLAWKKAAESGLPAEAEQTLQQQLEERIHTTQPLRLVFKDAEEEVKVDESKPKQYPS